MEEENKEEKMKPQGPQHYVNEFKDDSKKVPTSWVFQRLVPSTIKNIIEKKPFERAKAMTPAQSALYEQKYRREMQRAETVKMLMIRKPEVFSQQERLKSKQYQRQRMNGVYLTGIGILIFALIERRLLNRSLLLRDAKLKKADKIKSYLNRERKREEIFTEFETKLGGYPVYKHFLLLMGCQGPGIFMVLKANGKERKWMRELARESEGKPFDEQIKAMENLLK